jgi:hypothetical protein
MAYTQSDLDNVETAIRNRISGGGVISYSIGSRSLRYMDLSELRELRREIAAELQKALYPTGAALATFRRPA